MAEHSVKLLIEPQDVALIKTAQQRITLGKAVSASAANVIWLSIEPLASTDVAWSEEFGIFVSTAKIADGTSVTMLSETEFPARDQAYYTLTPSNTFNGPFPIPGGGVPPGIFAAQNDVPFSAYPSLTFGLTQSAAVNQVTVGRRPLSATPVLATQSVQMASLPTVYVWLEAQYVSGTIITKVVGKSTKMTFGSGVDHLTLKYEPSLGMFVPSSDQGKFLTAYSAVELLGLER
jgi:hypothetical protein